MDRFDKFTDRARKVLTLAQDEAQRFNHNYIGTEHLLLGLVREGEGVAARVLENMNVELAKVRTAVDFIIGRGGDDARRVRGAQRLEAGAAFGKLENNGLGSHSAGYGRRLGRRVKSLPPAVPTARILHRPLAAPQVGGRLARRSAHRLCARRARAEGLRKREGISDEE